MGVLERGDREKNNETGLKEGGVIKIETTVLSIYAMHALFRFVFTHVLKPSPLITTLVPPSSEPMLGTIDVIDMTYEMERVAELENNAALPLPCTTNSTV